VVSGIASVDDSLILKPKREITMAYLDGSYLWKDYAFSATIASNQAKKIFLLARFQDSANYIACRYTNNTISIVSVGETKGKLHELKFTENLFVPNAQVAIDVKGDTVVCHLDGKSLVLENVKMPEIGGAGVRAEDFNAPGSYVSFKEIKITPVNSEVAK
jgi:hypothetical protein